MSDGRLGFPPSEARFWEQVANAWADQPGLLLAFVPVDLNGLFVGRHVRDLICQPIAGSNLSGGEIDNRLTYCYDLEGNGELPDAHSQELLPRVFEATGCQSRALAAAEDGQPFYLLTAGVRLPTGVPLDRWVREVASGWPGPRHSVRSGQLHCCLLATGSLPRQSPPLPEGCWCLAEQSGADEEILAVVQSEVDRYWGAEDQVTRRFLASAVVDMASGRRPHAELALDLLIADWGSSSRAQADWRPAWPKSSRQVQDARRALEEAGCPPTALELAQWQKRRSDADQWDLIGRLWAHGLWRRRAGAEGLWSGLTSLARAALARPVSDDEHRLPSSVPDSTQFALRRCMEVELQVKDWLLGLLDTSHGATAVRAALDAKSAEPQKFPTQREYIISQMPVWQARLSDEELHQDRTVVAISSVGALLGILYNLPVGWALGGLRDSLQRLKDARNLAAHGGWFNLSEFRALCEIADGAEEALSHARRSVLS